MKLIRVLCVALTALLVTACSKDAPPVAESPKAEAASPAASTAKPMFGGVTEVIVEAQGVGETPEIAVLKAIDSAVVQVNGRRVSSAIASLESQFRTDGPRGGENIRTDAFMQAVVSASQGAVTGFKILAQEEIQRVEAERIIKAQSRDDGYTLEQSSSHDSSKSASRSAEFSGSASSNASADASSRYGSASSSAASNESADGSYSEDMSASDSSEGSLSIDRGASSSSYDEVERKFGQSYWKVRIEAKVAKYVAPDEKGRPKLAIVMPRFKSDTFAVGDNQVPAADVAGEIRTRLSDSLTQTKRFIILDREFGDVLGEEAAFIESGNARNQELARIGQQMATDLLLVVSVDRFEYPRATRTLRMSDRQLISYAGGGKISLKLINATTGEVVMSESFAHELPATAPSTMPRVIDGIALAAQLMDGISGSMAAAVVNEIFPVSVVAMTGASVALSQGGQSVSVGNRYQAVLLGQELIDPQTGNSLGRMESPCCVIRIDRVSEQTSYGTIEGELPQLSGDFAPGMIELREQITVVSEQAEIKATAGPPLSSAPARAKSVQPSQPKPATQPEKTEQANDDADW